MSSILGGWSDWMWGCGVVRMKVRHYVFTHFDIRLFIGRIRLYWLDEYFPEYFFVCVAFPFDIG